MEGKKLGIFVLFAVAGSSFASTSAVPLFMWSTNRLDQPAAVSGHTTTKEEFFHHYFDSLVSSGQNVVAFVQDKLSIEDVTRHGDVYNQDGAGGALHNLKHLLEYHSSTQLPSVKDVPGILDKLQQKFPGKVHSLSSPYDVSDLSLDDKSNLIIARLPSTGETTGEFSDQLQHNDEIIKSVSEDLKSTGKPLTALFSAEKSSQKSHRKAYTGRRLLAHDGDATSNYTLVNISDSALLFYTTQIEVTVLRATGGRSTRVTFILPAKPSAIKGQAGNATGFLNLTYTDVKDSGKSNAVMNNLLLAFNFEIGSGPTWTGFWRISSFNISYNGKNSSLSWMAQNAIVKGYDIYAPYTKFYKYSYHCTQTDPYFQRATEDKTISLVSVKFSNLQVQYSQSSIASFGRPNDCTGFFTIPILSGLFAGFILIIILFYGISMIANITTMDRFDDPKGKTITVNVSE